MSENATGQDVQSNALLAWLVEKLSAAESAKRAREQACTVWRTGSERAWQSVGCRMSKRERLHVALREHVIAGRCRTDVEMFRDLIAIVKANAHADLPAVAGKVRRVVGHFQNQEG